MATVTTISNDVTRIFKSTEVLTAGTTLTNADSGKVVFLNAAGGGTVTLPSLKAGSNFKFIIGATEPTTAWVIDSAEGDNIDGVIVVNGASVAAAEEDQINFVASTAVAGDFIELECDGSNWFVSGIGSASGSITATDPS
jgi:hypothetical protein|tara:strand:+ start:1663 stop:2082 length:420 start_codon:yes stop_codon:yes gene_type:complete